MNVPLGSKDKVKLNQLIKELVTIPDENLLGHFIGALVTHEYNKQIHQEDHEYFRNFIESLRIEILKRMKT